MGLLTNLILFLDLAHFQMMVPSGGSGRLAASAAAVARIARASLAYFLT